MEDITAYGLIGLPGAGKSTVAEEMGTILDADVIETGDYVRAGARDHFGTDDGELSSQELGDYSTMRRRTDGGDYVAQDVIADLDGDEGTIIISGMRDTEVPDLFDETFGEFSIIWIHAPFDERLSRLQGRGRQDEGDFTADDLASRDGRESMWGTTDLMARHDIMFENTGDEDELYDDVSDLLYILSWQKYEEDLV